MQRVCWWKETSRVVGKAFQRRRQRVNARGMAQRGDFTDREDWVPQLTQQVQPPAREENPRPRRKTRHGDTLRHGNNRNTGPETSERRNKRAPGRKSSTGAGIRRQISLDSTSRTPVGHSCRELEEKKTHRTNKPPSAPSLRPSPRRWTPQVPPGGPSFPPHLPST